MPADMMPEIKTADSATVIYYKNPPDNRFFTVTKVKDIQLLETIIKDANQSIIETADNCESVGKIYFYKGSEQVYVLYFSSVDECKTFSFIRTGIKYYVKMSTDSKNIIAQLKESAVEPTSSE